MTCNLKKTALILGVALLAIIPHASMATIHKVMNNKYISIHNMNCANIGNVYFRTHSPSTTLYSTLLSHNATWDGNLLGHNAPWGEDLLGSIPITPNNQGNVKIQSKSCEIDMKLHLANNVYNYVSFNLCQSNHVVCMRDGSVIAY